MAGTRQGREADARNAEQQGKKPVVGKFVDGGVSPFNNSTLQALTYATFEGYRVDCPSGADKLLLVSVGTGSRDPALRPSGLTGVQGLQAIVGLMDDCAAPMETLLQWMSTSPTARQIDREVGDLRNDRLAGSPLVTYLRYNLELSLGHQRDPKLRMIAGAVLRATVMAWHAVLVPPPPEFERGSDEERRADLTRLPELAALFD